MSKYQYIFWDWNGTIIDDVHVALDAVNCMLQERDYPLIDLNYYRELMDTPILRFYEPIFDLNRYPFEEIAGEFQQLYQKGAPTPFAGIREILEQLQRQGHRQVILSSSDYSVISDFARRLRYTKYFDAILGADNLYAESKVGRALQYMRETQILPEQSVLIGDTVHDYEVASEMGIDCILLTCGHQSEEKLRECDCLICANHQELFTILSEKS